MNLLSRLPKVYVFCHHYQLESVNLSIYLIGFVTLKTNKAFKLPLLRNLQEVFASFSYCNLFSRENVQRPQRYYFFFKLKIKQLILSSVSILFTTKFVTTIE